MTHPLPAASRTVDLWHGGKKIEKARVVETYANCFVKRHLKAPEDMRLRDPDDDRGPQGADVHQACRPHRLSSKRVIPRHVGSVTLASGLHIGGHWP